jgi:hypothetical protein
MSSSTYQPPGQVSALEGLGNVQVAVIGAGQAGLAVSHELSERGVDHVVLERARVGQTWRGLWDSFCLVTPNWTMSLPGFPYAGDDPEGFVARDGIVGYLEGYASSFGAPVREGVSVDSLEPGAKRRFCCAPRRATWRPGRSWCAPAPSSARTVLQPSARSHLSCS